MHFNLAAMLLVIALVWPHLATGQDEPAEGQLTDKQVQLNVESFDYVWTTVRDKYFDPELGGVDWNAARDRLRPKVKSAKSMGEVREAMDDLVSQLGVSHFAIIPATAYDELAKESPYGGVTGISVRILDDQVVVTQIVPDSPAARAGVKLGWAVRKVGSLDVHTRLATVRKEVVDHPHRRTILAAAANGRLRGRLGDEIAIDFDDGKGETIKKTITLAEPRGRKGRFGNIPEFYVWVDRRNLEDNIGYVAFNAFLDPVYLVTEFNQAMNEFREAPGIIIDVRGNGGGMGEIGMGMIGWFLEERRPPIGTVIFRDTKLQMIVNPRPRPYAGPVVVLTDELSVSAAEFFASGFKDLDRARLIGTRTAGAVLGSSIERLPNGDGFQYAAVNFISTKTGEQLEGIGVKPHQEVKHSRKALLSGRDLQMEAAIQWIKQQRRLHHKKPNTH